MSKSRFYITKILLIYFLAVSLLYYPVITTYFSQDDFFHFKVSQTDGTINQFINLFGFHSFEDRKIAFYRPLFREASYNVYYQLFNLNSYPFRIFQFVIHFTNIFLLYWLVFKIYKDKLLAFFVSFFFGISAANVGVLYYLAGGIQASGATLFILSSLLFFWQYLNSNKYRYSFFSFGAFLLALSSHELSIATPMLFGLLILKKEKKLSWKVIKKIFLDLYILILIIVPYLFLEIFVIGFSNQEKQYQLVPSFKGFFNSLFWYFNWSLGLPEMLIDFVNSGLKINPDIFKYWSKEYIIIFSSFIGVLWILFLNFVYLVIKKKILNFIYDLIFLFTGFTFILLPVLLLPLHKSTYYLSPALPLFWLAIGLIVVKNFYKYSETNSKASQKIFIITFFMLFLLSFVSSELGKTTYWAASRGKISKKLITDIEKNYPELDKGSSIYFRNDPNYPFVSKDWGGTSKQAYFALNNQDGLQLFYRDPNLKVFYEDINKPKNNLQNVFPITAKLN